MFARFGHFVFNGATFNEVVNDADSLARKDFVVVTASDKNFVEVGG